MASLCVHARPDACVRTQQVSYTSGTERKKKGSFINLHEPVQGEALLLYIGDQTVLRRKHPTAVMQGRCRSRTHIHPFVAIASLAFPSPA